MTHNILFMRYPMSSAGVDSAKWISGIDPAKVQLTPDGEKIAKKQKLYVETANDAIAELKELDSQIASLCIKREIAHLNVVDRSVAAVAPVTKSYTDANRVYREFLEKGFSSDIVKTAVFQIRKTLFDDSQDIYREILCSEINLTEGRDMRLEFVFEHTPSCRCFSIEIPVKRPKPKETAGKWYTGYDNKDYSPRYGGDKLCTDIAGLALVQPYNNGSTQTIAYHYDIRVFKKQLDDYVRNGFKTLAEDKNESQRWIWYDGFDSATKHEFPMSAYDYQYESTY